MIKLSRLSPDQLQFSHTVSFKMNKNIIVHSIIVAPRIFGEVRTSLKLWLYIIIFSQ